MICSLCGTTRLGKKVCSDCYVAADVIALTNKILDAQNARPNRIRDRAYSASYEQAREDIDRHVFGDVADRIP